MQDRSQTEPGDRRPPHSEETMTRTTLSPVATPAPSHPVARRIHDARRLRQAVDLDGALSALAGADTARAATPEARWAYAGWLDLARRRFSGSPTLVYSPGTGRAAALTPRPDGALQVVAVLGMRSRPGTVVSRRSLRRLQPLRGGTA